MKKMIFAALYLLASLDLLAESKAPLQFSDRIREDIRLQSLGERKILRYKEAKIYLFGELHIEEDQTNGFYIKDVYCEKIYNSSNALVGPNAMPDQNKLNCEHTWPQSKFVKDKNNREIEDAQLSDLHHLFPSEKNANQIRANYDFANVITDLNLGSNCTASKSGQSKNQVGNYYFEPPKNHKGNVARAMFYFSIRYQLPIDDAQEATLRSWDKLDPINEQERERNDKIEKLQGNRNPFVDYPNLADQIKDF